MKEAGNGDTFVTDKLINREDKSMVVGSQVFNSIVERVDIFDGRLE